MVARLHELEVGQGHDHPTEFVLSQDALLARLLSLLHDHDEALVLLRTVHSTSGTGAIVTRGQPTPDSRKRRGKREER
jgi:hypothetical protein